MQCRVLSLSSHNFFDVSTPHEFGYERFVKDIQREVKNLINQERVQDTVYHIGSDFSILFYIYTRKLGIRTVYKSILAYRHISKSETGCFIELQENENRDHFGHLSE